MSPLESPLIQRTLACLLLLASGWLSSTDATAQAIGGEPMTELDPDAPAANPHWSFEFSPLEHRAARGLTTIDLPGACGEFSAVFFRQAGQGLNPCQDANVQGVTFSVGYALTPQFLIQIEMFGALYDSEGISGAVNALMMFRFPTRVVTPMFGAGWLNMIGPQRYETGIFFRVNVWGHLIVENIKLEILTFDIGFLFTGDEEEFSGYLAFHPLRVGFLL